MRRSWFRNTLLLLVILVASCSKHEQTSLQGFIEGRFTLIVPYSSGYLTQHFVTGGDLVKKGQALFTLDPYPEQAQLEEAMFRLKAAQQRLNDLTKGQRNTVLSGILAQLQQAKAQLLLAQQMLRRDRELYRRRAIGRAKLDESLSAQRVAQNKVNEIKANLSEAKLGARANAILQQQATVEALNAQVLRYEWIVRRKSMSSPVNARVFDTYFRKGEYVQAGQAVVSLLAPENVKLIFYIPEPKLSSIKIGQKVQFGCDGCKKRTTVKIDFISTDAEYTPPVIFSQESRAKLVFRVEATLSPKQSVHFNPGQPVDVYLSSGAH